MDHLRILKRAWQITWKYRALWLVSLLLVLAGGGVMSGSGSGGGSSASSSGGNSERWRGEWGKQWGPGMDPAEVWQKIAPIVIVIAIIVLALIALGILIGVISVFVRYVTRTSLIQMVQHFEETGEETGVGPGLRLGWSRSAFRLFLINLILKLPVALVMVLLISTLVGVAILGFITESGPGIAMGVLVILLIIPVIMLGIAISVVLGPIIEVAHRACVIEGLGAWEAIVEGFGLIRRNLGATALQWLLLIGLGIAWTIALIPVNLILVILGFIVGGLPALLVGGAAAAVLSWPWGLALGILILIPFMLLVVGLPNLALSTLATVFYSTTWTLTYRELRVLDVGAPEDETPEVEGERPADSVDVEAEGVDPSES